MKKTNRNLVILHITIVLLSFPSLFAKGMNIPADILSCWRCMFASLVAFGTLLFLKKHKVARKDLNWLIITGSLMGLHWWTYFSAIQLSTVAIGILALFTNPIIIVLLEPLFFNTKVNKKQVIGAIGIIAGVFILIPEFNLSNSTTKGIMVGLLSALFFALRNILTRKHLSSVPAFTTMGYHVFFAFVILTIPLLFKVNTISLPTLTETMLILILAILFTLGSHGLLVYSLKHFTASTTGILGSLQVVYGTLLAFALFGEQPDWRFYISSIIILGVAIYEMKNNK